MTKKQENELNEKLKRYDDAVRLFSYALTAYVKKEMPQVNNPVLYVRSRGKALYAVVCDINDATRSSHADYYSIYEFLRQTENYKWMDFEEISRLAIKWAFAYTQNINLYDFSPDYGRFLYVSELFGRVVNDGNGIANIKDPVLYIFKTRGKSFGLGYRDSSAVKNTSTSRVYAVEPLTVIDVNLYEQYSDYNFFDCEGAIIVDPIKINRIAAEWVFGLLK